METERLTGLAFVLPASILLAVAAMSCWYSFMTKAERARGMSVLSIFIAAPFIAVATVSWRWGITTPDDSPAAGLPIFFAFYETFWIWCGAVAVVLLLHSRGEDWMRKREERRDDRSQSE